MPSGKCSRLGHLCALVPRHVPLCWRAVGGPTSLHGNRLGRPFRLQRKPGDPVCVREAMGKVG